ncbi:hypothetical protein BZA77DRAFT_85994 [Pyronema omphalodes]|nr:hypothetical protein BZA77DRAFT_85994 [Pyronema omphalodes]
MASNSAPPPFARVLNSITETKFSELTKKRAAFVPHLDAVRKIIDDDTINPRDKVRKIIEKNTATSPNDQRLRPAGDVDQYKNLLSMSEYDPSISEEVIKGWAQELSKKFEIEDQMQVYGGLFANLLKEWLSSGQPVSAKDSDWEAVEKIGRKEMHDQRAVFEKFVFNSDGFDTDAGKIKSYLDKLFNDSLEGESALEDMRERIKTAAEYYSIITESAVVEAMQMLLKNDLLSNEKQATLKEFLQNKVVLKEITDVIKIYFSSIDTWSWPEDGITVEMRRQINGKYRVYMDEEIIQAVSRTDINPSTFCTLLKTY